MKKDTPMNHDQDNPRKKKIGRPRISYKRKFTKRDRAVRIIKEMSEFLRILDLEESDILKTMIVRFAIESVEASQGSLISYDKDENILKYQDTFVYDGDNKIVLDPTVFAGYSDLLDVEIKPGEGLIGECYETEMPILVEDYPNSKYPLSIMAEVMDIEVGSAIAIPLKVNEEIVAILEITHSIKKKEQLNSDDLEAVMIIANFASTILENAKLFMWAIHDSLTSLYNKHYFSNQLVEEAKNAKKFGKGFSIAMFDIDFFKHINDGYGHTSGDYALKALADKIRSVTRRGRDISSRYGGDEFVIVFRGTKAEEAYEIAEKLRQDVADMKVKATDGREFSFTLSIGIAEFPKHGDELYLLFNHADEAAYESKKVGKNAVTIYSDDMTEELKDQDLTNLDR